MARAARRSHTFCGNANSLVLLPGAPPFSSLRVPLLALHSTFASPSHATTLYLPSRAALSNAVVIQRRTAPSSASRPRVSQARRRDLLRLRMFSVSFENPWTGFALRYGSLVRSSALPLHSLLPRYRPRHLRFEQPPLPVAAKPPFIALYSISDTTRGHISSRRASHVDVALEVFMYFGRDDRSMG